LCPSGDNVESVADLTFSDRLERRRAVAGATLAGGCNTAKGDRILGELWAERIGDAV
jgi:hypothetical protein